MSSLSPISPIALGAYNPSQVPKPVLLTEFTARRGMMDDLLAIMRSNAPRHPCQHSLLIGPRGYGKTTSLYALKYRLEDDPKLIKTWIPLLFDEENYHIADLAGFWLECLRLAEIALEQKGGVTYASLHTSRDPKLEDLAREAFLSLLTKARRRALLRVDNLPVGNLEGLLVLGIIEDVLFLLLILAVFFPEFLPLVVEFALVYLVDAVLQVFFFDLLQFFLD
jgi:hypothetical protein